ncbi:helix-turn-helix transcriptional regulator [Adhaeribacter aerolatus]|uniref:Helix-turn-helix transcriptional regulator n=1 Tax=Adhaeribacter aerolatus TaxID=670289 RepID=A0A512B610_9BACT|nr:helix-turn-helix transcriptional regulator [Adhaeribacter aerolatus]
MLNQPYGQVQISYENYIRENPTLVNILNNGPCVTWILDMRTLQFSFLSNNVKDILGYDNKNFEEQGLAYFNQIVHPDDVAPTWQLVMKKWECLMALPPYQRTAEKMNISYRIIQPNGNIMQVLEQSSVLQLDDRGHVTHVMGVCSDISLLEKLENKIAANGPVAEKIMAGKVPADPVNQVILSKRELQIVKLIAAGYKSRDIAQELFISFHTVNTHRQKIIEKTNSKNTSELIQYVMTQKLIDFE